MTPELRTRIRAHYAAAPAEIRQVTNEWVLDAHAWDHDARLTLTPIEAALWEDIRAEDLVLYPQYPIGVYFVDFGNPAARVAIECDGAAFHQDARHDELRQRQIEAAGWFVYRITGKQCLALPEEDEGESGELIARHTLARRRLRWLGAKHNIARTGRTERNVATAARAWGQP